MSIASKHQCVWFAAYKQVHMAEKVEFKP